METIIAKDYQKFQNLMEESVLENYDPDRYLLIGLLEENDQNEMQAIGCLVGHVVSDVFFIDSLYVLREYRWLGGGRMLVNRLENELYAVESIKRVRIDFDTLTVEGFYLQECMEALGYTPVPNYDYGVLEVGVNSFFTGSYEKLTDVKNVKAFADCDKKAMGRFINSLSKQGLSIKVDDLYTKPIDEELSQAYLDSEGNFLGFILATSEHDYRPEAFFYMVSELKSSQIGKMFKALAMAARDRGYQDMLFDFDSPYVFGIISLFCQDNYFITHSYEKDITFDRTINEYQLDIDKWGLL